MSYPHQHEPQATPRADGERGAFAAPRLELPRFQFAPRTSLARTPEAPVAQHPSPQQQPVAQPTPDWLRPSAPAPMGTSARPMLAPTQSHAAPRPTMPMHPQQPHAVSAYAQPQPVTQPLAQYATPTGGGHAHAAPQLTYATTPAPAPVAAPARPAPRPVATPMSNSTRPATVSWDPSPPQAERTLLQRITPVHMGVLMIIVVMAMVVSSGPAAMSTKPARLPATVDGGGTGIPAPVRAGSTAVAAATPKAGAAKAATKSTATAAPAAGTKRAAAAAPRSRVRMLVVGSARLRANVRAGGIPSPAAAANLAVAGGGRVSAADTGAVQMGGIPSAAASEQLGPQKLPFRPTDGVTLPRAVGERDSHATDTHYGRGAGDTLAMEEPALPAMTPGAAAELAQHQASVNAVTGNATPIPVAGGLAMAY